MPRTRTGETTTSMGEVVVAACQNQVVDCAIWSRAQVQCMVHDYVKYYTEEERRAITDAGFLLHRSPTPPTDAPVAAPVAASEVPPAAATPPAAAAPLAGPPPTRTAAYFRGPKGKRRIEKRLRTLSGTRRALCVVAPSDVVIARPVRSPILLTFGCPKCTIRYSLMLTRLGDRALDAGQFRCICTAGGESFSFKDCYSNNAHTFYANLTTYIKRVRPHTQLATSHEAFVSCRGSVLLRCTQCASERRTTTTGVFLTSRVALPPCECLRADGIAPLQPRNQLT